MNDPKKKSFLRRVLFANCDALGVGIWSCPSFIFLIMGAVIIVTILTTYVIAEQHADPEVVIAIVTLLTVFLLIITQVLVNAFEKIVRSRQVEAARTKEVAELKDQFLYLAVHDLASAATAVKWGLKMLERNPDKTQTPYEQEIFSSIRTRNDRLVTLVHQIALITQIEHGEIMLHTEPVLLSELLNDAIKKQRGGDAPERAACNIDIAPQLPLFITDRDFFNEIIDTLLYNARMHAPHDGCNIAISAKIEADTVLVVAVENNGEGIPAELQAHIFEKFWRNEKTGKIERAGFGLYIAQSLARLLGGDITFTSDPTITCFTLRLPLTPPVNT
ncbi:MAG: hypothetical protein A2845_03195 [Candidatus Lloydbacteria bacterium RIFCSPHIGHO2_01_FULL_49_22]|uniref:histidine kinase n=1 Tax=Candidatus Lloydbacteria bacterium RIFCSPHIGHO2_01_FULL_49_22 TaxID=1798658 RepID=A0A1G2CVQ4_9BACT|nr:MAG: hypothetical protein A2845_03195 [Candidatus Lloydbacteria bacterium RIFCSPHIGHO2_01_FULL_49_22]OGZ09887.1 MAG: hypothetical protein A3C14_03035 [Candidatus Lloydbacteria bacterium RIFCSPHIGHO2_02_FULL_50_18]